MPAIRQIAKSAAKIQNAKKAINWHPGHMFAGMKAMMGKLNTVDCVIEVHDARIPLIGRNTEFRNHLGVIKPHVLVLNKADLADLSKWPDIRRKLAENGDNNVLLTDLSGGQYSYSTRGYDKLLSNVVDLINASDRFNRSAMGHFKIMIVGIPNVGKSTLINRLRQLHLGRRGEATKTGNDAGVTRHVEFMIKICSRPLIYSLDTPGVLEPSVTKDKYNAIKLALCSTINDKVLEPEGLVDFALDYLNRSGNFAYQYHLNLDRPLKDANDLITMAASGDTSEKFTHLIRPKPLPDCAESRTILCWRFIRNFRSGNFGKVMLE